MSADCRVFLNGHAIDATHVFVRAAKDHSVSARVVESEPDDLEKGTEFTITITLPGGAEMTRTGPSPLRLSAALPLSFGPKMVKVTVDEVSPEDEKTPRFSRTLAVLTHDAQLLARGLMLVVLCLAVMLMGLLSQHPFLSELAFLDHPWLLGAFGATFLGVGYAAVKRTANHALWDWRWSGVWVALLGFVLVATCQNVVWVRNGTAHDLLLPLQQGAKPQAIASGQARLVPRALFDASMASESEIGGHCDDREATDTTCVHDFKTPASLPERILLLGVSRRTVGCRGHADGYLGTNVVATAPTFKKACAVDGSKPVVVRDGAPLTRALLEKTRDLSSEELAMVPVTYALSPTATNRSLREVVSAVELSPSENRPDLQLVSEGPGALRGVKGSLAAGWLLAPSDSKHGELHMRISRGNAAVDESRRDVGQVECFSSARQQHGFRVLSSTILGGVRTLLISDAHGTPLTRWEAALSDPGWPLMYCEPLGTQRVQVALTLATRWRPSLAWRIPLAFHEVELHVTNERGERMGRLSCKKSKRGYRIGPIPITQDVEGIGLRFPSGEVSTWQREAHSVAGWTWACLPQEAEKAAPVVEAPGNLAGEWDDQDQSIAIKRPNRICKQQRYAPSARATSRHSKCERDEDWVRIHGQQPSLRGCDTILVCREANGDQ